MWNLGLDMEEYGSHSMPKPSSQAKAGYVDIVSGGSLPQIVTLAALYCAHYPTP
jgi:hypothetical protein